MHGHKCRQGNMDAWLVSKWHFLVPKAGDTHSYVREALPPQEYLLIPRGGAVSLPEA